MLVSFIVIPALLVSAWSATSVKLFLSTTDFLSMLKLQIVTAGNSGSSSNSSVVFVVTGKLRYFSKSTEDWYEKYPTPTKRNKVHIMRRKVVWLEIIQCMPWRVEFSTKSFHFCFITTDLEGFSVQLSPSLYKGRILLMAVFKSEFDSYIFAFELLLTRQQPFSISTQ